MLKPLTENELKILNLLEKNSAISIEELSSRSKIPLDDIQIIKTNLEDEGIILKYKAIVNWEKIESPEVVALIQVNVTPSQGKGYDEVARKIAQLKEVTSCLLVSGSFDLLVEVLGPSLKEVALFVAEKLAVINGVENTKTNFLLKRYKQGGDLFMVGRKTHRLPIVV